MIARNLSRAITSKGNLRSLHVSASLMRKNDSSTIDSYKLPSQTSINEWEFKYDFIPKEPSPKIPPVTTHAINQDKANMKRADVEKEIIGKERASVKVEGNTSSVVHGGEKVTEEPTYIQDKGSSPVDAFHTNPDTVGSKKPANREKYVQSSINPHINKPEVVNMGDSDVEHKIGNFQSDRVVDDLEHDQLHESNIESPPQPNWLLRFSVLGVAGAGGYYYFNKEKN